jgi:CBS domain-containing protein
LKIGAFARHGAALRTTGEDKMKVEEAMTSKVQLANPDQSLQEAAGMMVAHDIGVLPVGDGDRLIGVITDRDIAVRGVAKGLGPKAKVREAMSAEVLYCFDDDDVNDVVANMADIQVRRLPVVNRKKRLVGIISLGDIANTEGGEAAGKAMEGIAKPGGQHSQSLA